MSNIPLTTLQHEHTAAINEAADWLFWLRPEEKPSPIVPELQRRFGLTLYEAMQSIAEANLKRARAM